MHPGKKGLSQANEYWRGKNPFPAITAIGSAGGFFACRKTPLESGGRKEVKERMSTQMEKLLAAQEKTQEKLRRAQEEEKQLKKRIAERSS